MGDLHFTMKSVVIDLLIFVPLLRMIIENIRYATELDHGRPHYCF